VLRPARPALSVSVQKLPTQPSVRQPPLEQLATGRKRQQRCAIGAIHGEAAGCALTSDKPVAWVETGVRSAFAGKQQVVGRCLNTDRSRSRVISLSSFCTSVPRRKRRLGVVGSGEAMPTPQLALPSKV